MSGIPWTRFAFENLERHVYYTYGPDPDGHHTADLCTNKFIAIHCGVSQMTVHRWRRNGLTVLTADRAATALGQNPGALWPDFDTAPVTTRREPACA